MLAKTMDARQAQKHFRELLLLVQQGTEVVIEQDNLPVARLVPISSPSEEYRIAGLHEGEIWMSDDFDQELPDSFWLGDE